MITASDLDDAPRFVPTTLEDARREAARPLAVEEWVDLWFAAWAGVPGFWLGAIRDTHQNVRKQLRTAGRDRGCTGRGCS